MRYAKNRSTKAQEQGLSVDAFLERLLNNAGDHRRDIYDDVC
jgi:hypothetical protein